MATWVDPVDSQTDPDAPITSDLAKRWDNNVVALAEGAAGAPRIAMAAMGDWYSSVGDVGTYAMLRHQVPSSVPAGGVVTGNLSYADMSGSLGGSPVGSWMCMGHKSESGSITLWLRVS